MDQGVRLGGEPDCYLDTRQAAAVLGLSARTLEGYRVTGGGPPFLTYCNRIHYLRADLYDWVAESRRRSTSDDGAAGTEGTEGIVGCWCAWTLRARKGRFPERAGAGGASWREPAGPGRLQGEGGGARVREGERAGALPARRRGGVAGIGPADLDVSDANHAAPGSACSPAEGALEPSPGDVGDIQ